MKQAPGGRRLRLGINSKLSRTAVPASVSGKLYDTEENLSGSSWSAGRAKETAITRGEIVSGPAALFSNE